MRTFLVITAFVFQSAFAQEPTQASRSVPQFDLATTDGKRITRAALAGRPTLMLFLNSSCPHNGRAVPDLNELRKQLGQSVRVLAVIDRPVGDARSLLQQLKLAAPAIADPQRRLVRAFGVTHSLDLALVSADGRRVVNRWNGVSRAFISEIQTALRRNGAPRVSLTLSRFSEMRRSGCGF